MDLGLFLAAVATILLGIALPKIKSTTLFAPWCWLILTIWSIALAHTLDTDVANSVNSGDSLPNSRPRYWVEAIQFAAHALVFCPFMSLLGARRPQNKMWEFIVFSLWLVLILPALETVLLSPGQLADTQGIRAWFMLILIGVSAMNVILSRFWVSGLLIGVAQFLLVNPSLPSWSHLHFSHGMEVGLSVAIASFLVAFLQPKPNRTGIREEDVVWLDYRDMFGGMWALRIKERINQSATMYGWDLRLTWTGFVTADGAELPGKLPEKTQQVLHQHFYNLMRKFVSRDWINRRLLNPKSKLTDQTDPPGADA
ncbi:MAG: hypothetical protein VX776_11240 [Planctomycetota bacterium]|nr:hypothetical protein [Planctomycetota bacterium]